ncbi:MAG: hypothetical protein ACQCXQ_11835 [Verrucomicrobiales bacterium]|nr:hypothetical protein [Verrucomicrobiota bacterium JB025]
MKTPQFLAGVCLSLVATFGGTTRSDAILPMMEEDEWLGYFVGVEDNKWRFGMTSQGKITIFPIESGGKVSAHGTKFSVQAGVQEVMPNGSVVMKTTDPESLTSENEASLRFDTVTISGEATGGVKFEMYIEQRSGFVMIGGKVTDPGELKNPRFAASVYLPKAYSRAKPPKSAEGDEREIKKWQKKQDRVLKKDKLSFKRRDGERGGFDFLEPVLLDSEEVNGKDGMSEIEVECEDYNGRDFVFNASPNSVMTLSNGKEARSLANGVRISWHQEADKDPEGKARFAIKGK